MLSKALISTKQMLAKPSMNTGLLSMATRGIYAPGTEPYVFINQHTKVICQGMTGKHVSSVVTYQILLIIFCRVLSTLSSLSNTAPRWLVVSTPARLEPLI